MSAVPSAFEARQRIQRGHRQKETVSSLTVSKTFVPGSFQHLPLGSQDALGFRERDQGEEQSQASKIYWGSDEPLG